MSTAATKAICQEARDDLQELQRLRDEVEALAGSVDEETFLRRPAEGRWSAGECVAHLNAITTRYLQKLPDAVAQARRSGLTGEGPVKRGILGRIFLWALRTPWMRVKAPQAFLPKPNQSKAEILAEYHSLRDQLAQVIESSGDLDFSRVRMGLPTIQRAKLSLGEVYAVLLTHEQRHLLQAKRALGMD